MKKKLLSPKNDEVFKSIFGDKRNSGVLAGFLQSVIDLPPEDYKNVTVLDPHLRRRDVDDKLAILDVKVQTHSGKTIDIEIQLCNQDGLRERIVYYTSKMITEQIHAGEPYKNIKKVITIVITDFVLIEDSSARHNCYRLHDARTGSTFSDIEEIHTLELPKAAGDDECEELKCWLRFFKAEDEEEYMHLALQNESIGQAVAILRELSEDKQTRMRAEAREKGRRDQEAREDFVFEKGIVQGRQEGIEVGMARLVEAALALKNMGIPADQIALATGLSPEQIAAL